MFVALCSAFKKTEIFSRHIYSEHFAVLRIVLCNLYIRKLDSNIMFSHCFPFFRFS